jgi:hypothetical protein
VQVRNRYLSNQKARHPRPTTVSQPRRGQKLKHYHDYHNTPSEQRVEHQSRRAVVSQGQKDWKRTYPHASPTNLVVLPKGFLPNARPSAFIFDRTLDLIRCRRHTPPKVLGGRPAFIFDSHRILLTIWERRIVKWRWWNKFT